MKKVLKKKNVKRTLIALYKKANSDCCNGL